MKCSFYIAGLAAQSLLYVTAGINHFWHLESYLRIMPPHYSNPAGWVRFTGVAELLGGLGLLVPATRRVAAIGLVVMLTGYFDVHLWMARHAEMFAPVPAWAIYARIPLQFVLIAWAWVSMRSPRVT